MSNHPVLSPRLGNAQITDILASMDAEIALTRQRQENALFGPRKLELEGVIQGLGRARQILEDAWTAEVVTSSAVSQWVAPLLEEEGL